MTARRRIANYDQRLREYTNYAVRGVKKTCKACGPRPAASQAERDAQEMMARDLEACCDEVRTEPFKASPGAFMAWLRIDVVLGFLAAAAYYFGFAVVSAALLGLALLLVLLECLLCKQVIDIFLPKKTSQNVVGVLKPTGEMKRRLVLCGHADSSNEWTYNYLSYKLFGKPLLLVLCIITCLLVIIYGLAISVIAIVMGKTNPLLGYIFAGLCLPLLSGWFFENKKRPVDGASDNLTGCFTAMAAARMLKETNSTPENTELVVLCTGCKEPGLRGAKAFAKAHAREYRDVETVFISLDTLTDLAYMGVYYADMTGLVRHDPAVCALLRKAANAAGHDIPYEAMPFGSGDAAAAAQAGIRSASFAAMDQAPAAYYHTRLDTVETLQPKTIEACLDVVMETACQFDETGLAPFEGAKVGVERV